MVTEYLKLEIRSLRPGAELALGRVIAGYDGGNSGR